MNTVAFPLLRLHGYPVSNYVTTVRAVLIEKRLPHELSPMGAGRDEAFLAMNPMGKIPVLEADGRFIAETVAIIEFLDDRFSDTDLRPSDLFERGRSRQIVNVVQLYVEAPARRLYPGVFGGGVVDAAEATDVRVMLERAAAALLRLATPAPFFFGDRVSQADIFTFHTLELVDRLCRHLWSRSLAQDTEWARWRERMSERTSARLAGDAFVAGLREYTVARGAAYREPQPVAGVAAHA